METIKKEKKSEGIKIISVGQLMKSLMDKKWIPRGDNRIVRAVYDVRHKIIGLYEDDGKEYFELVSKKSLRELVSIDSGLWQFVCENGMCTAGERPHRGKFYEELFPDYEAQTYANNMIIESALCDEDKLEEFLLSNIKVDVGNRG